MSSLLNNSKSKVTCTNCALYESCIPKYISRPKLETFENIIKRSSILHKGDYLHHQGDPVKSIYIIRSGAIKGYMNNNNGDEQICGFYLPGELIGLDSLHQSNYKCAAVSLETTTYCALPLNKLDHLCTQIVELQQTMMKIMSKVISFEEKMLLAACNKKANERVATFLLSLSKRYKHIGYSSNHLYLPMSRREIGIYLGLSSETISRVFMQFQNQKIIDVEPKMITIRNMSLLKDLNHGCSKHKIIEHHVA